MGKLEEVWEEKEAWEEYKAEWEEEEDKDVCRKSRSRNENGGEEM